MHYKPLPTRGPNPPAYTSPGVSSSTLGGVLTRKEMEHVTLFKETVA